MKSSFARFCAGLIFVIATAGCATSQTQSSPNLVITLADDVSANEYSVLTDGLPTLNGAETPTFNKMVAGGVSFLTGWSMPICGPTRGSFLTGLYAQTTGWFTNAGKPKGQSLGVLYGTFAQLAQQQGYKVLIAGKWQMQGQVKPYGFDEACLWQTSDDPSKTKKDFFAEFDGPINPVNRQRPRYWYPFIISNGTLIPSGPLDFGPNIIFDCAMNFITRQVAQGNKFLVYMPMLLTHTDYDFQVDDGRGNKYIPVPIVNNRGDIVGREPGRGTMKRNVEYQDYLMGKLLAHLKSQGVERDTITFFMGDNGSSFYGKKVNSSEFASRVPFTVYGPGRVPARGLSRELVSTNDVYATVASFVGATAMGRPQSVDLGPYLTGRAGARDGRVWIYGLHDDKRWIRTNDYIYDGLKVLHACPGGTRDERLCTVVGGGGEKMSRAEVGLVRKLEMILCLLEVGESADPFKLFQAIGKAQDLRKFLQCQRYSRQLR